ncbi:MAG: GNAT family N-acetyltransferase [Actinomycetota bacterium]|nr:GNAT family N-acetyltransferase [Actinomycetota bacterium]
MKIQVIQSIPENLLDEVTELLLEAFAQKVAHELRPHSDEQAKMIVKSSIVPDLGWVALDEKGKVIGVIGVGAFRKPFSRVTLGALVREFGIFGAVLRWLPFFLEDLSRAKRGEWRIEALAVKDGFRGRGIGTALLEAVIESARSQGVKVIKLEVVDTNEGAQKLYERLGFKKVRSLKTGWLTAPGGYRAVRFVRLEL